MEYAAELFPILSEYNNDSLGTLSKLKDMGYRGIEMFGVSKFSADELKQIIDQSGLVLTGYQLPWREMQASTLISTINYQQRLGNKHLIIDALGGPWESGHKVTENTVEMWKKHAKRINEINKELIDCGMDLTYHTHAYDYGEPIENTVPSLEILLKYIDASVGIEVDTGNCIEGGQSPVVYIDKLKNRVQFVHCKPYSKSLRYDVSLGSIKDENKWSDIIKAAKYSGTNWLVVEPESTKLGNIFDVMNDSLKELIKYQ